MPATITTYYIDELEDWSHSIDFCNQEIGELTERLTEVISRNSIPDIANKVEVQQAALDKIANTFHKLQLQLQEQETALKPGNTLKADKLIKDVTVQNQDVLRRDMQAAEKDFIDVKYNCHYFLSHLYKV